MHAFAFGFHPPAPCDPFPAFPAGAIALQAMYSPAISSTSLVAGAAVMGVTAFIPYTDVRTRLPLPPSRCASPFLCVLGGREKGGVHQYSAPLLRALE